MCSEGPVEGRLAFVIITSSMVSATGGVSHALIFIYGRAVVLGELLAG